MKKNIFILIMLLLGLNAMAYEVITINSVDDIKSFNEEKVSAVSYKIKSLDLNKLEVKKKKEEFIKLMLPSILIVKSEIREIKTRVIKLKAKEILTHNEQEYLDGLFERYKVENDIQALLKKLNTVPVDLALAQAIIESGWGTSRFFVKGNNCYGAWTYRTDLPRIESKDGVRNGKKVYLRKFNTIKESVENYFYNLSVSNAYEELRSTLENESSYNELTKTLAGYSEKGDEYGKYLNGIISYNKLTKYSNYKLDID